VFPRFWGQHYDRRLADILLVQEEISRDIFENLRLKLNVEEQKAVGGLPALSEGPQCVEQAHAEGLQQGIDYFQQAITTDPNYAAAYAGLADCYNMRVIYGVDQRKMVSRKPRRPRSRR